VVEIKSLILIVYIAQLYLPIRAEAFES